MLVAGEHELSIVGLGLALTALGWEVETTTGPTGVDVVDHARRFEPRYVLLDACVGRCLGAGTDLIESLLATGAEVVILTTERRRAVLAEYLEAGAAGWINKSASIDDVHSALERLVAGGRLSGRTERAALLDLLRRERARTDQVRATFERLTECEAYVLAALADG